MSSNLQLDHIAINVKEKMDEAYNLFSDLGFSLTPRGYHSLGSINHSIVFENNYLELIGNQIGKPINRPELRDAELGINGLVFKSENIEKTYEHLTKLNFNGNPPRSFNRPVMLGKSKKDAKFKTVSVKSNVFKAGRVYFCDHLTPDLVWIPEYKSHINKSVGIIELVIIDSKPSIVAKKFKKMSDEINVKVKNNCVTLMTKDILISVLNVSSFKKRYSSIISQMIFRPSMFGAISLKMKSLSFFKNIQNKSLKNILTFQDENKVQIFIKDYNFIIEIV